MPEPHDQPSRRPRAPFPLSLAVTALDQPFKELLRAMSLCVQAQLYIPALVLLYSSIDTAGWLGDDEQAGSVRKRFVGWADCYLIPSLSEPRCTAVELYGARCGVVHTMAATSDLTGPGVRKIIYAWHPNDRAALAEMTTLGGMDAKYVAIQGDELISAFADGLNRFLADLEAEPQRLALATRHAEMFLRTRPPHEVDAVRAWAREILGESGIDG